MNPTLPASVVVDIIDHLDEPGVCSIKGPEDFCARLRSHGKCVLFALPGAFTPTCSAKHLPGFIAHADELRAKGVEAIYCLSVNDKFVMQAWFHATAGCKESGVQLVADGNGEFTSQFGMTLDCSAHRMGLRSKRYAAIIENGVVTTFHVDEKGFEGSSAESILGCL